MGYLDDKGLRHFWEKIKGCFLPSGGTIGQILRKVSDNDYDVEWTNAVSSGDIEASLPTGCIVIWSGAEDNIPSGWALCDGTNGTPDLRNKFVLGAGEAHSVGETGGSEEVTLTYLQMPEHSHAIAGTTSSIRLYYPTTSTQYVWYDTVASQRFTGSTGGGQPHPNMPPYYTLCFIMKLTL